MLGMLSLSIRSGGAVHNIQQKPIFNATREITIGGRPEEVWPWLVQMGYRRGGWYGYVQPGLQLMATYS